jgi:hypothetical protein
MIRSSDAPSQEFERSEEFCIEGCGDLHDFCKAVCKLHCRKRTQKPRVNEHGNGLMKRPQEIFPRRVVNPDFPSDAAVDLREERRWNLDKPDSAQHRRGDIAGEVSDDAAAQPNNKTVPFHASTEEARLEGKGHGGGLRPFPGRNCQQNRISAEVQQPFEQDPAIPGCDVTVGDNKNAAAPRYTRKTAGKGAEQPGADRHGV